MPIGGAWVQPGWQDKGVARVVLARTQPTDSVTFGVFIVDLLCTGVKDTSYAVNVAPDAFDNEALPQLYGGDPPVEISEELAHEIVWGSVEYSGSLGLRPHVKFRESQQILEQPDALPRTGGVQFGYRGRPLYVPGPTDNQVAVLRSLIETVGLGNFYYLPQGEVPADVAELLGIDTDEGPESPSLWTPDGEARPGAVESGSGLWVPGQPPESAQGQDASGESAIWTPGRS